MLLDIIPLVILALASYRITRFLVIDSLLTGSRNKLYSFLLNRAQKDNKFRHVLWDKLYELLSCTWCLGFHVSWVLLSIYTQTYPWDFGFKGWISAFAIAGVQGMIHALEPGDD